MNEHDDADDTYCETCGSEGRVPCSDCRGRWWRMGLNADLPGYGGHCYACGDTGYEDCEACGEAGMMLLARVEGRNNGR